MSGTSLAEQLKRLAAPQTSILVHSKKRQSLLFEPKDAADINRATFYEIGITGLEELKTIDPRLAEFERTLFDEASQHLERAVEDQQANAKLDQLINRFLILISPYLNLKAAHQTLEWLIQRFHIHQYNTDSIVSIILPYHDTNIFARMVQILPLQDKSGRWIWLEPLKKEGIPMSKQFLLSRASSDMPFFKFICNLPLQAIQVHGEKSYCLTTLLAFYCTTVIGALDQSPQVSEVQVTHLLPSLIAGICSSHIDFTASAFMILGHLVTKIRLTVGIFSELFYKVAKCNQPILHSEAALVLVVMAQSGRVPSVLPSVIHLSSSAWFLPSLSQLAASGVVVYPLVAALVSDSLMALKNSTTDSLQQDLLQNLISKLLEDLKFNNNEATKLLKLFAETPLTGNKWFHEMVHQLEKSYPGAFDQAVKTHSNLVSLIPGLTARNELFQKLNHPSTEVRLKAVLHVKSQKELLREEWVQDTLATRLTDDSSEVVKAVLEMCSCLPVNQLTHQLISVVTRSWHSNNNLGPLALSKLKDLDADPSLMLLLTLPFLLPSGENGLTLAKEVLKSSAIKESMLLKPLFKKLAAEGKNIKEAEFYREVYKFIVNGLKRVTLEEILKAGKQLESHGKVYQLMTVLAASGTVPDQVSSENVGPLLLVVTEYNNSSSISGEIKEELNEDNLAALLFVCKNGKLPFQGSLYALSKIMDRINSPLPEGRCFCDIQEPSIALIVDIFSLVLQMTKSRNKRISKSYSAFCDKMFGKCCEDVESQIDLLSNIALGCPALAGECVHRLSILVEELASVKEQTLVPALLVALHSVEEQVRHSALAVLRRLTQKLALPTYHKLLDQLAEHSEEIAIDNEQVNVALYYCLSPDPSVQSLFSKSDQKALAVVLDTLINIVTSADTPAYVSASLLNILDQVNSQSLLERLAPLAMKILLLEERSADQVKVVQAIIKRISAATAGAFNSDRTWSFVETCLSDHKPLGLDGSIPAILILQQIDRELFGSLNTSQQQRLISLIVSRVTETEASDVTSAAASCFKKIILSANIVADLLEQMRDVNVDTPADSTKKRGWSVKKPPPLELLTSTAWKQGLCLLEFIQNKKKLENVEVLLPRLFEILNRCLQFEEQSPVEYTKQVLLTSLLHCCSKLSPDGRPVAGLPEASVQVELVVECVRLSSNPQTHHHALLLLAHMASMVPERVLHSLMPIFTFMGSSVLRQDDAYSFQIISKIVETIVPVLMMNQSENCGGEGGGEELTAEVVGVLRVFAGALLDVPEHRRVPLYTKLLTTLRQGRLLWAFLALVFDCHVRHHDNTAGKESGSIPKRLEACLQLCHQFPPAAVLSAGCHLMNYLCQLPVDKGDKKVQSFKKSSVGMLFDIERATDKQLRHYTYTGLTFLSLLLSSKQFLRMVATLTLEEIQELEEVFQQLFEAILTFTQSVSKQVDISGGQPSAKYWKSMFNICFDVLTKTNALLPGDMFLSVVSSLLTHELLTLRVKALELLNWRLQQAQPMDPPRLLILLPQLLSVIKMEADSSVTEHQLVQQTALLSVKFLARQLAAEHPEEFQPVFKAAVKLVKKRSVVEPVLASAVLCVGELCHTLGAHAIANLPSLMPQLLAVMGNDSLITSGDLLLLSVVSAVHKVVDSLACFLSPYLDQLLQQLCILSADCSQHSDNPKVQPVLQKIKIIRQKLSSDVPHRALLPAVSESYNQLVSSHRFSAVVPLLSLLGESFKSGQDLTPELSSFFLHALEFRSKAPSADDVATVEPAVIKAIIALVFKLSESSFRPFYYRVFNWAFQSDSHRDRSITFYKLSCSFSESLKGLFVSFAQYFLKNAASLLDENNKSKKELTWSENKAQELVDAILHALHTVFLHDASHFVTKERFDTLMQPLVDQLENDLGGEEAMHQRTTELVIPCLTQMAVSAADDTLWKQLNYQILLKTRHNLSQVRIGGVLTVCEIAKKLGEEFLPLLPETVPFLAELLEDEDENVEKTSRRVVQELEAALGEPISKYF